MGFIQRHDGLVELGGFGLTLGAPTYTGRAQARRRSFHGHLPPGPNGTPSDARDLFTKKAPTANVTRIIPNLGQLEHRLAAR
jgi:hypothetical protein